MFKIINDFVFYHPYTITGLYAFLGIILGVTIDYILRIFFKFLAKITNRRIDKFGKRVFKKYIPVFFSVWGIYNCVRRILDTGKVTEILDTAYSVFSIYIGCKILLELILAMVALKSKKEIDSLSSTSIVENVIKIGGYIVIIFIILTRLGISITPIITALGIGGIAIALAFQDILSNLFSGIFVIASSQLKPGDFVKIENTTEGFVVDISWRNTTIRELAGNHIYVPNSKIATATITNYRHPDYEVRVVVPFSVSYDSDLDFVEKTAFEVAKEIQMFEPGAVKNYEPIFRVQEFNDCAIRCSVYMRASTFVDQYAIKSKAIKAILVKFKEVGINIPFPITTIKQDSKDYFKIGN